MHYLVNPNNELAYIMKQLAIRYHQPTNQTIYFKIQKLCSHCIIFNERNEFYARIYCDIKIYYFCPSVFYWFHRLTSPKFNTLMICLVCNKNILQFQRKTTKNRKCHFRLTMRNKATAAISNLAQDTFQLSEDTEFIP